MWRLVCTGQIFCHWLSQCPRPEGSLCILIVKSISAAPQYAFALNILVGFICLFLYFQSKSYQFSAGHWWCMPLISEAGKSLSSKLAWSTK